LVLAPQRTLIRVRCTGVIDQPVTLTLLIRYVTLQLTVFLGAQTAVALLVYICSRKILTDSELLICPLDTLLY
jgi:hypothetical protein